MVPRTKGAMVELVCNECGIVEGSINRAILWAGRVRWRPLAVRAGRRVPSMAGPTPVEPKREFVEVVFRAAITIKDLRLSAGLALPPPNTALLQCSGLAERHAL